jgi:hypothetical protein
VRGGKDAKVPKLKWDNDVIGFQYLFPKFLAPKLEAGADLVEGGNGHLHVGWRHIYFERSYFRPGYKLSLDHFAESKEGLATLTKINNYFARVTGTLEYVVWNPYSVRLEAEIFWNLSTTRSMVTVGLSRGW